MQPMPMLDKMQPCGHRPPAPIQVNSTQSSFGFESLHSENLMNLILSSFFLVHFIGSQQAHEQIQSASKAQGQTQQPQQAPTQQPQPQQAAGR